jgi:hypothetical protein
MGQQKRNNRVGLAQLIRFLVVELTHQVQILYLTYVLYL